MDVVDYLFDEGADADEVTTATKKRKRNADTDSPPHKKQRTSWSKDELYGAMGLAKIRKYIYGRLRFSTLE